MQDEFAIPIEQLIDENSPVLGSDDAPVTIFDFSDFQCPMCARYAKNTEPLIIENYVNTGKVKLVYKHFSILGQDSINAAKVSQCVNEQGQFWEFNKILYNNQKGPNSGWASKDNLVQFASQIPEVDIQILKSCIDGNKYESQIFNNLEQVKIFNFSGTPAFIVVNSDGSKPEIIAGAFPFTLFKSLIDKKLSGE
jgi:protein-disulfide isomerase